jgi:hypothetical protein
VIIGPQTPKDKIKLLIVARLTNDGYSFFNTKNKIIKIESIINRNIEIIFFSFNKYHLNII